MARHPAFFEGTEMPTAGWWATLWPDPAAVLEAAGVRRNMDAIDLCCGDGWFTLPMAKVVHQVIAIDLDRNILDAARARLADAGMSNCEFVEGDAYEVATLTPRPVDFVFMANTFHGVPDRPRLAAAVREALKPGGHFAIVNWHRQPREQTIVLHEPRGPRTELRLSPQQTIGSAEAGGLLFRALVELPPYHYLAIVQRGISYL
jgi:SAM-dependent methyltransferase